MAILFALIILFIIIWSLIANGTLFKIILVGFAFIGMRDYLLVNFNFANKIAIIIADYNITYSSVIPAIIIFLALGTIKND